MEKVITNKSFEANFAYTQHEGHYFVKDIGMNQNRSVTNDAERVVDIIDPQAHERIFYQDFEENNMNELLHQHGQFTDFNLIQAKDIDECLNSPNGLSPIEGEAQPVNDMALAHHRHPIDEQQEDALYFQDSATKSQTY